MESTSSEREDMTLAITLQLEELNLQVDTRKGKHKEGEAPDFDVAVDSFAHQLEALSTTVGDEKLAVSIAKACAMDAEVIAEVLEGERVASSDRQQAITLGGGQANQNIEGSTQLIEDYSQQQQAWETSSVLPDDLNNSDNEDLEGEAECTIPYGKHQLKAQEYFAAEKVECGSCTDMFPEAKTIQCPCTHKYCIGCLKFLIFKCMKDESLFPLRCCRRPIPDDTIEDLLNKEDLNAYHDMQQEYRSTNRTYCSNVNCSKFIPSSAPEATSSSSTGVKTNDHSVECRHCGTCVCTRCKNTMHEGECKVDEALQQVLQLAETQSWRRCFRCQRMVELETGCNHMTCKCQAEFCYVCGIEWKRCNCAQWDERRLYTRAVEVVNRDIPTGRRVEAHVLEARVRNMMGEIERNHNCTHPGRWQRREDDPPRRGYRCEICGARHWKFILTCRHCHVSACQECRCHRV